MAVLLRDRLVGLPPDEQPGSAVLHEVRQFESWYQGGTIVQLFGRIVNGHVRGRRYCEDVIRAQPFSHATWIGSHIVGGPRSSAAAPFFRKPFVISQPVVRATLSITALGVFECEINGRRVGDEVFAPGWTDYRKRVLYRTYDVADLLRGQENVLGVILGDGWFCGYLGPKDRQFYGDRPRMLCQLEMVFEDGTTATVASDPTWKTSTGPILESDFLQGESYDARLELGEWSCPRYDDSLWAEVIAFHEPSLELTPAIAPPVRRIEEIRPLKRYPQQEFWIHNACIFDLGQNFSGRVRLTIKAEAGVTVVLRFGEMLMADQSLYTDNLRSAQATDSYTCRGSDVEVWEPRFTFHGFRYVEVKGFQSHHSVDVTGIVLHSDLEVTGYFACSNQLLNKLQENIGWSQRGNFLEVPTDCPQRDERLGWTGDAHIFARTACFNMDVLEFYRKWLQDVRDAQRPDGSIPCVAPDIDLPMKDGGPGWSDAAIICPWVVYLCYGDLSILKDQYPSMQAYLDFVAEHRCIDHIRSHPDKDPWGGFGDWLALDGSGTSEGQTPKSLIGTAFYAHCARIMTDVARLLGYGDDVRLYEALHRKIVAAFRDRFVTPSGLIASGTQCACVLALHFDLVPEGSPRENLARELVRDIKARGMHLATGFIGTPYILDALENHGHLDIAYQLLEQETFPSWLFPVKNGATTIWERWDGWTPEKGFQDKTMNSFNHYAYGAVGAWMVRSVAGLDVDAANPGYKAIVFRPRPGGTLTWAEARLETPFGEASIRWDLDDSELKLSLQIPPGASGRLSIPPEFDGEDEEFGPGRHHITLTKTQEGSLNYA